ncbi:hypothetical protein JYU34_017839 [Plutella xylostella]|uniref:Glucose-methanol-choline oxidoreductase N-terminal domain-containing protein n=1 Tax=Plutella xylostella TaxID=51655 RepID=A0ABQ7Q222_PLUXY|nr:hypothetical protein JYU34_017839 [Plutella xylostella]
MLGGCSSINSMMYTRGNPEDFNEWARMGCENWDWDTVYPYFLKSEGYEGPELSDPNFAAYHNTEGPMKVTKQRFNDPNVDLKLDVLLQSLQEIGINSIEDYNGPTQFGISRGYFMHSAPPGVRSSTAECFLRGGRGGGQGGGGAGGGLHVLKHALATRVLLRGAAAVGVELTRHNKTLHVFATKEVILSAGAIGTPRLLLASGIGRRDDLERLNVKQIVDLPVGYDLQDHLIVPIAFTGAPTSFVDQQNPNPKYSLDYFPYPRLNGFFSVSDWSRPQLQLSPYYFNQSSPLVFKALNNSLNYVEGVVEPIQKANADSEIFMMCLILLHPKSRGRIVYHSVDPLAAPDIYLGYLTHDDDLSIMREGIKKMLRLTESRYFSGWGARAVRLQLPTCAGLEYGSDEYWECYALALARTVWHQAGTARAGGAGGVLDAALRVRGLQRLRVVDASALPAMPSGNTHATVMMLAERAADLIKEEYYG